MRRFLPTPESEGFFGKFDSISAVKGFYLPILYHLSTKKASSFS